MTQIHRQGGEILLGQQTARQLAERFGTPLYLYDEVTLRARCRQIKGLCNLPNFRPYYSAKANTSIALLKIIKEEGLKVDAMSLGELALEEKAGFLPSEILFLSNNVSSEVFAQVVAKDLAVCVDSITQLQAYLAHRPQRGACLRINPGQGAGHHEKVITAGKVKFGVDLDQLDQAMAVAQAAGGKITGFMVHIGSLFLTAEPYLKAIANLLELAKAYPEVEYIDFGGGLGIPYNRAEENPFPLEQFSQAFNQLLQDWMAETGRQPTFAIEPGRFVVAEAGVCLARVQATKVNAGIPFVGTDLGFNFLIRPEMYGSYHEILHAQSDAPPAAQPVMVVGNVCESGDYLGKNRLLPPCQVGDLLLVRDTGAYGYAMASNYNSMPRPAEVLIQEDGQARLIRRRESPERLWQEQIF